MGRVWQGPDCGPGRDLRPPPPQRNWSQHDYPGSHALDRTLAGADELLPPPPSITRATYPPDLPAGQMYDRPARGDVRRDLGAAQLVRKAVSKPQPPVVQRDEELPTEKHPPPHHAAGFRVVRDHGGSAQVLPIQVDRTVADMIGRAFFDDGAPSPAPGRVCAHEPCGKSLTPATHSGGGADAKKYCSAAHRARASEQRKRQAATLSRRAASSYSDLPRVLVPAVSPVGAKSLGSPAPGH